MSKAPQVSRLPWLVHPRRRRTLALERDGVEISTDGNLDDQGIYYYVTAAGTGAGREDGNGLHIIPYQRGSEWFRLIVENRPNYSEDVAGLDDINSIRNGVFALDQIHTGFNPRRIVILKTPNHILGTNDIPSRHVRGYVPDNVNYPTGSRYTLQWLVTPNPIIKSMIPNNSDAAFKKYNMEPKPSDLLLHYNYDATAVKWWGRGVEVLQNRTNPPRPPSRTTHDRATAIPKRDPAQAAHGASVGNAASGAVGEELVESEGKARWDEDDVMLFFWGNSRAAKERHLKRDEENTQRMEQWRRNVQA